MRQFGFCDGGLQKYSLVHVRHAASSVQDQLAEEVEELTARVCELEQNLHNAGVLQEVRRAPFLSSSLACPSQKS